MVKKESERKEAWFKILVLIISGIILMVWRYFVFLLAIINWVIAVFKGKRNKDLADLCEYFNTESYKYLRYLTSVTNDRPFPFSDVERISKFK